MAIGAMTSVHGLEHFCSSASAIWTAHRVFLLSVVLGRVPCFGKQSIDSWDRQYPAVVDLCRN